MIASELSAHIPQKMKRVKDLVTFLDNSASNNPSYAFFLGAGASATSSINTGKDLIRKWRKEVFEDLNTSANGNEEEAAIIEWLSSNAASWYSNKAEYSALFGYKFSLKKQRQDFIEGQVSGKMPSIGYPYLVKIAEKKYINAVFTTNFDDLLNEAFYQFSSERPIVCAHDSWISGVSITNPRPKVIKLHGDYLVESLKTTIPETNRLDKNMEEKLREFSKVFGLIVIGYSGGDKSVMGIFRELIDDPQYLQNGLIWCLRKNDEVNEDTLDLLKKDGVFYVLIEGFDEMLAEIYGALCGDTLPFEVRPGSDFAAKIVKSYIENENLKNSSNNVIRTHIAKLEDSQKSSAVAEALRSLHEQRNLAADLSDSEFVSYLNISKLFKSRQYKSALELANNLVDNCSRKNFKIVLLLRVYYATKALNSNSEAEKALQIIQELEPDNIYIPLLRSDITDSPKEKLKLLQLANHNAPYDESVALRIAEELSSHFDSLNSNDRPSASDVVDAYKKSIELDPSIQNPAWTKLFDFLEPKVGSTKDRDETRLWILSELLKQDAYDSRTISTLSDWCIEKGTNEYCSKRFDVYFNEAVKNHFPKNYASYLPIIKRLYFKTGDYNSLKEIIQLCEADERTAASKEYIYEKIDIIYRVNRNIEESIRIAEDYLSKSDSVSIEILLLKLYLKQGNLQRANRLKEKLTGAISPERLMKIQREIYEYSSNYVDAIDTLNNEALRLGKNEDYFATLSYLYLKSGDFKKARETCSEFLTAHHFSTRYHVVILNYEFSKLKLSKNPSKQRLNEILSNTSSPEGKAVANLILGNTSAAKNILFEVAEKDFGNLELYCRWPILEGLVSDLEQLKIKLIGERRTYPNSVTHDVDGIVTIDV